MFSTQPSPGGGAFGDDIGYDDDEYEGIETSRTMKEAINEIHYGVAELRDIRMKI